MRLLEQFQASLFFLTKRSSAHKKHQDAKQTTLTLLFLCEQNIFVKKINRLEIALITSIYYTIINSFEISVHWLKY